MRTNNTLYSERLLEHFKNPRHAGILPPPAVSVLVENPVCGDRLRLSARLEGGVIVETAFQVKGCTAAIACGSALAERLQGIDIAILKTLPVAEEVEAAVDGLPNASKHAAQLAAEGVKLLLREIDG